MSPGRALSHFEARLARWLAEVSAEAGASAVAASSVDAMQSWERDPKPQRPGRGAPTPGGPHRREAC